MDVNKTINDLYRELYGKMVASLASYFGLSNIALAEDIVQDTFMSAVTQWRSNDIPDHPEAWLYKICKNKAINALSRANVAQRISEELPYDKVHYQLEQLFLDHEIKDSQLRLLFACCHSSLSPKAQVIFALKNICGLKTSELARGFAVQEDSITKSLNRSKQILKDENITMHVPFLFRSRERINSVHMVLYLMFNEGYNATSGDALIRKDLCLESMKLVRSILDIPSVATQDTHALMALMCFHTARFDSRINHEGEIVEMEHQNREYWDDDLIALGTRHLNNIIQTTPTRFSIEAGIAAMHCTVKSFHETRWDVIVSLYDQLKKINPSPFTDINQAVATLYAQGGEAALNTLAASVHMGYLENHYMYHSLLGKIAEADRNSIVAKAHYQKALTLVRNKVEQRFILKKIEAC